MKKCSSIFPSYFITRNHFVFARICYSAGACMYIGAKERTSACGRVWVRVHGRKPENARVGRGRASGQLSSARPYVFWQRELSASSRHVCPFCSTRRAFARPRFERKWEKVERVTKL